MSESCLVFDVSGDFAHFRKPETTSPAQTFGIPPRTTVAGMTAAILGLDRDSYYDTFSRESSRIAVQLRSPIRRISLGINILTTEGSSSKTKGIAVQLRSPIRRISLGINILTTEGSSSKTKGARPGRFVTSQRQQNVFETLCDPEYRLYVSLDDERLMDKLEQYLVAGKSHYALSLGLSEHLATHDFQGRYEIQRGQGDAVVDSVIPGESLGIVPDSESRYVTERVPGFMRSTADGRVSDGFQTVTYERNGQSIEIRDINYAQVGGETVVFG
ncbi:CRISPR-associated Cas5h family protein [Haloferax gibbonsii ATCC 33959]|uniref:CRISPR-associated Cas5h family protein n=1 Tax=Haloferax gibbonsii (strain ATCC 33959 / DSM 4427 / JCM 8863 / NBRC 102184 / NCIMB 2188 / Ma 2.38) TaxID=1227459 RepID=M0HIZ7_HALGM|nr:type I-B CRISPR-associated protein Cas5b [Haloferax gibbonsii]ELZ84466.1 CRISPR-associated Cas5h family protein [Haloferax gibbonsii ATCC 33959]